MIENVSSPDLYVYHYTKALTLLGHILKHETLQLGSYSKTNDPKETKAWEFGLHTTEERDLDRYRLSELSCWFSNELKSRAKLSCFAADKGPLSGHHITDILKRGFAKPRMWAQYAENHTGVCLVFDRAKLVAAVRKHFGRYPLLYGNVTYRDRGLVPGFGPHEFNINIDAYEALGPTSYMRSHVQQHHRALFLEKLTDWRDECEWRIVLFTDSHENLYLPIKDILIGVMHGDATDPDISERIMSMTKPWKVEHMGLSWKNSAPWYDYGSFRWIPGKVTRPRRAD